MTQLSIELRLRLSPLFELNCAFKFSPGFTVLFGSSGAGKTTMLDCITGLKRPDSGTITVNEVTVLDTTKGIDVPVQHRRIGYVFQDLALFPHMTVWENLMYGACGMGPEVHRKRAHELLSQFGIDGFAIRYPNDLSGGERQRVALARSLVTEPQALLLDEPLAALDRKTRSKIIADLKTWNEARNLPVLYVTHSAREALALGGDAILMRAGRIEAAGPVAELINPNEWD